MTGTIRRSEYLDLAERLRTHVSAGTTDWLEDFKRVPVDNYRDPARWSKEIEVIFKRLPILAGFSCELREDGAYKAITIVGVPILISRGKEGRLRAFLNVCRHRGAHVAAPGCGRAKRFMCSYHGWTYDREGDLIGLADEKRFGHCDKSDFALIELFCAERAGLVFVCLTPGLDHDIDEFLGDMQAELASFGLENWYLHSRNEVPGPNWKVAMDGYIEYYHIATLHRNTIASLVKNNVMACDAFGPHEFGPHQRIAAASPDIVKRLDKPKEEWETGEGLRGVRFLFPNNSFAITAEGGMISQIFPASTVDTSLTIQNHIFPREPETQEETARVQQIVDQFRYVVPEEDYEGGRQIQLGLNTDANSEFIFGRNEIGPQRLHTAIDHYLAAGL